MEIKTVELLNEFNELRKARGMSEAYLASGETTLISGDRIVGYEIRTMAPNNLNTEAEIQSQLENNIETLRRSPF